MDLYHHGEPSFTRWIIANKLLHEPFVVIDVGVQGGEHPRWEFLGDQARIYGFDAISEAIDQIAAANRPHRVYRSLAIGNEDGKRLFYVPANRFSASFYGRDSLADGSAEFGVGEVGAREVEIKRLDTLFGAGDIPAADYIKVDCEGFDAEVLRGAGEYLAKSNILCVTVETSFGISEIFPRTPFAEINDVLVRHRLLVFDLNYVRFQRSAYAKARELHPRLAPDPLHDVPPLDIGQPGTFDFVYCRDFVRELSPLPGDDAAGAVTEPTTDKLIKSMINFELHGLMDCSVDIAEHFRKQLAHRLDVDEAIALLLRPPPYARNTADVTECLRMIARLRTQHQELVRAHTELIRATTAKEASLSELSKRSILELGHKVRQLLTGIRR